MTGVCDSEGNLHSLSSWGKQAASHLYQSRQKDVKIKSALVITIKVKKIIAPKFPATSNPLSLLRSGCTLGSEKALLSAKEKYMNDFEGLTLQPLVGGILLY